MFMRGRTWVLLAMVLAVAAVLALPSGAMALSGKQLLIGTTDNSTTPAVVVDSSGKAYVAWTVPATGDEPDPDEIAYCVLTPGQSSCSPGSSGVLSAGPGNPAIGNLSLTIDGPDIVLVADQFQHSDNPADNYVNEWTTPDGQTAFTAVDGGESVSPGQGYGGDSLFTLPGAAALGGPLGYGYGSIGDNGGSYYVSVIDPFTAPPTCSEATESAANISTCPQTPTATMPAPGNASTQSADYYVTQTGPVPGVTGSGPGVLGVSHALFSTDCGTTTAGLAFLYGSGAQSPTNSYGIGFGTVGSAWHANPAIFDCDADSGVPVSGPAGLGAITDDVTKTDVLHYRPFSQSAGTFGPAVSVDASEGGGVSDLSAGEGPGGGIFTTYENGNSIYKGPNDLSYSPDSGKIWDGPVALTNLKEPLKQSVSAVGSNGQGWLVWVDANGSSGAADSDVYIQQFDQQDVPPDATKLAAKQTRGAKTGTKLVLAHGLKGEYDTATLSGINAKYATGKVTYTLVSSCSSAHVVTTSTVTLSSGHIPASKKVTAALAAGTYYWEAKYTGDRNNAAVASKCGSEVLTIEAPPHS